METEQSIVVEWWDSTTGAWAEFSEANSYDEGIAKIEELRKQDVALGASGYNRYRLVETKTTTIG